MIKPPTKAGRWLLKFGLYQHLTRNNVSEQRFGQVELELSVSCDHAQTGAEWCSAGPRLLSATGRCVGTYRPCGQDLSPGVPNGNNCTVYTCLPVLRSCSADPVAGRSLCGSCSVPGGVSDRCLGPGGIAKQCGDDGNGAQCGACDAAGAAPVCAAATGTCQPTCTGPGCCRGALPLLGVDRPPGSASLAPGDAEGTRIFLVRNDDPSGAGLVSPLSVGAGSALTSALPADGQTVPAAGIRARVFADLAAYEDASGIAAFPGTSPRSLVFRFVVPPATGAQGFEAYALGRSAPWLDAGLRLLRDNCTALTTSDGLAASDVLESDDATPPGGRGARVVSSALPPGAYKLVVSARSPPPAGTAVYPVWLEVVFTASSGGRACAPRCDGRTCGPNGCGGVCGVNQCGASQVCRLGSCSSVPECPAAATAEVCKGAPSPAAPAPYTNTTYARQCGADPAGCGLSCGTCPAGRLCQAELGLCVEVPACNHLAPACAAPAPAAGGDYICNSQCEWEAAGAARIDLVPALEADMVPTLSLFWKLIDEAGCPARRAEESCVTGTGWRLLLRFGAGIVNIGTKAFRALDPFSRPDVASQPACSATYRQAGVIDYALRELNHSALIGPSPRSMCLRSSTRVQTGPKVPCSSSFSCEAQGLDPGAGESFPNHLDCQWLDVTALYSK